jgi:hypothetical protein
MTPEKLTIARPMYDSKEYSLDVIAETIPVSRSTVCRHLAAGDKAQ